MGAIITNFKDLLVLVLFFSFTIFIHELGHFLVALRRGMVVEVFSIGFGPALWKRRINGITYKLGWIPFGGYVALPQLDPTGMATVQGEEGEGGDAGARLPEAKPRTKIYVAMAGAVGNLLLAVVMAVVIWLAPGAITHEGAAVVGHVDKDSVASARGLREGDIIRTVNGKPVRTWYDVSVELLLTGQREEVAVTVDAGLQVRELVLPLRHVAEGRLAVLAGVQHKPIPCTFSRVLPNSSAADAGLLAGDIVVTFDGVTVDDTEHFIELVSARDGRTVPIVVQRGKQALTLNVTPTFNAQVGHAVIGVSPTSVIMPWMQYKNPWDQLRADAAGIVRLLRALVTPDEMTHAAKGLGGPVAILATLWLSIKLSFFNAIGFLRFLNVNLAILNLLPIPVLDGGHIVFAAYEGITRRKVPPKVVNVLVNVFAVLLIGAFIALTVKDVDTLFPGVKRLWPWGGRKASADAVTNTVSVTQPAEPAGR